MDFHCEKETKDNEEKRNGPHDNKKHNIFCIRGHTQQEETRNER